MGKQTTTYPTEEQRERWEREADRCGMSLSEFVEAMVEGGMKRFDPSITPDEANAELREQRNNARKEAERLRKRVERLENRLDSSEFEKVRRFIQNNPGATEKEIVNEIQVSAVERVPDHLLKLRGQGVVKQGTGYFFEEDAE